MARTTPRERASLRAAAVQRALADGEEPIASATGFRRTRAANLFALGAALLSAATAVALSPLLFEQKFDGTQIYSVFYVGAIPIGIVLAIQHGRSEAVLLVTDRRVLSLPSRGGRFPQKAVSAIDIAGVTMEPPSKNPNRLRLRIRAQGSEERWSFYGAQNVADARVVARWIEGDIARTFD